jgi:phosphoglycerate dehydrogenase-like enzyme
MKILIASSICPQALDAMGREHDVVCAVNASEEDLCAAIADRDVLVFRSGVQISRKVMSSAPDLKLLVRAGSGLDNLDVEYAQQRNIQLVRIPEPGAQAVAELAFGMMINLARQIRINDCELRKGHWTKQKTTGYVLANKVLGIVGAGNIGSRVGQMGVAWGMRAIGCVENESANDVDALTEKGIRVASLKEVVKAADFLSIHVPKTDSTRNLVNARVLSWMKPTSFLINMARGGIVDENALYNALQNGQGPAGAALDVHEREGEGKISPLAALPNVLLTPHIGATTVDTMHEIGQRVIKTLDSFAACSKTSNTKKTLPVGK